MRRYIILVLLAFTSAAWCGPTGPQSLKWLISQADLIVIATVENGVDSVNFAAGLLRLERVIKGSATAGASIPIEWALSAPAMPARAIAMRGMWFRKENRDRWQILPVLVGNVPLQGTCYPVPPGELDSFFTYSPSASINEKVGSEIAGAASHLQSAEVEFLVLGALSSLDSPIVRRSFQHFAQSTDRRQRALGLAGLIRLGDVAAVHDAYLQARDLAAANVTSNLSLSIRQHFRNADPGGIAFLGAMATSADVAVALRLAAAHALRAIHTREALPYLGELLDSDMQELRHEAIAGFSSFTNNLPIQTPENTVTGQNLQLQTPAPYATPETLSHFAMGPIIAKDEPRYLNFWKAWWNSKRAELNLVP